MFIQQKLRPRTRIAAPAPVRIPIISRGRGGGVNNPLRFHAVSFVSWMAGGEGTTKTGRPGSPVSRLTAMGYAAIDRAAALFN